MRTEETFSPLLLILTAAGKQPGPALVLIPAILIKAVELRSFTDAIPQSLARAGSNLGSFGQSQPGIPVQTHPSIYLWELQL